MLKYNLTLVLRRFRKERVFTVVNILGLTVGLTAFLLITLFVRDELSFDKFHENHETISRLIMNKEDGSRRSGYIPPDFTDYILAEVPSVESYVRITKPLERDLLSYEETSLYSDEVYFTDSTFFTFFEFQLLEGSPYEVLSDPYSAVITESLSKKLFQDQNPLGRLLELNKDQKLQISGVVSDPPRNSSFQFEMLVRAGQKEFENTFSQGYLRSVVIFLGTHKDSDRASVAKQIDELKLKPNYGKPVLGSYTFELLPLSDHRLKSGLKKDYLSNNDIKQVYLFSGIGIVILLLAVINYINLVTARALKKSREIGLRKVIGAEKRQLISYELFESVGYSLLGMLFAFATTERLLVLFNSATGKEIELDYFSLEFVLFVPAFGILLGLIAGLYPAFYITRFKPLSLIQNAGNTTGKSYMRKALATIQFLIAAIMICVTFIMRSQMNFIQNRPIGFEKELLVNIDMYQDIKENSQVFRNEVMNISGINSASLTSWEFVGYTSTFRYIEKFDPESENRDVPYIEATILVGDDYLLETLGLNVLKAEPSFSMVEMDTTEIIVSQLFIDRANWSTDAIGKYVYEYGGGRKRVVAIIEDFHSDTYKNEIVPTIIEKNKAWGDEQLLLRLESKDQIKALDLVASLYENQLERPFEYQFVNEQIDFYYRKEAAQIKLFNTFSGLAIFLSLLGLLAMTFYAVEQRRKEVSIRKVLGASMQRLILMLNKEHSILVTLAFLIASPIAYYAMQGWLQEFEYRINLTPLLFILVFLSFLVLSWIVTIVQSLRVSNENPANVLRED